MIDPSTPKPRPVRRVFFEQRSDDSATLPPQPAAATQRSTPFPQSTSGGPPQGAPATNSGLGTFGDHLLACGGRIIRFLGSDDDFLREAATVPIPNTSWAYRGQQVHFLDPIRLGYMDQDVVSAFLARVKHFLNSSGGSASALVIARRPAPHDELMQLSSANVLSHGVNNPGMLDADAHAAALMRSADCAAALPEMFKRTIPLVGTPGDILVQPFLNLECEPAQIEPTLMAIKNLRADNLVWLPVCPPMNTFRRQESMLWRLCTGTLCNASSENEHLTE